MNREDIKRMARECGIPSDELYHPNLERFADLVAAAAHEACAKECKFGRSSADIEQAIRARGETTKVSETVWVTPKLRPLAKLAHEQELELAEQPAQTDWEAVSADQAMTIALLKAEQPAQQEPVAWMDAHQPWDLYKNKPQLDAVPLYTSPPAQRTWAGLTDEEAEELWESTDSNDDWELMKRTEAKLRSKNT